MSDEEKPIELVSQIEANLPPNTKENPQPTLFRVEKSDLYEHTQYIRSFAKNTDIKAPNPGEFQFTDKLNDMRDEYVYSKTDPKGEQKITENGYLLGGRKYIITTFTLPGRGKKLYVLGTEAAKFLNHRDAFVLFNKFKQLYKSKTNDEERKFLEDNNFSISKIKSRSVAVTTAKNLFMLFGARVIKSGKRVEDDYWEEAAIEQGFKSTDQVFPLEKGYSSKPEVLRPRTSVNKSLPTLPRTNLVTPLPPLEDRKEYLVASSTGNPSQVLPGQGISGGIELATVATIPKYKQEGSNTVKHRSLLSSLSTNTSSASLASQAAAAASHIPISDTLAGEKSTGGLPYYSTGVLKRIRNEDADKIREIEYIHGTVETNNYITLARKPRVKQWNYYWQVKSGAPLGLTEKDKDEYFKDQEDALTKVHEETIYNELLYCDQIIKKRRRPNPNYLNHGNIKGLKPPYIERPVVSQPQEHLQHLQQNNIHQQQPLHQQIPVGQHPNQYNQHQMPTHLQQQFVGQPHQIPQGFNQQMSPQRIPQQGNMSGGIPQHMYNDHRINQYQ